ncbi:MAG: hypothetical protein WKG07_04555 [Hymenobacter sp.]
MLYLALLGITMLFVTLVAMYDVPRGRKAACRATLHPFPRYFSLSTVVLLASSYVLAQAPRLYRADDLDMPGALPGSHAGAGLRVQRLAGAGLARAGAAGRAVHGRAQRHVRVRVFRGCTWPTSWPASSS